MPCAVKIYDQQDFINDHIAFPDTIYKNKFLKESILVFDRGLQTRKVFNDFTDKDILFVGRIKTDVISKLVKKFPREKSKETDTVELLEDLEVYLYPH